MPSDVNRQARTSIVGRIWVSCTVLLIAFLAYGSQLYIILPAYRWDLDRTQCTRLMLFNLSLALLWLNYASCVLTDPGSVPRGWIPNIDESAIEVKRATGRPRFCRSCQAYKPPRAHHCRQCKRCVLRMDHHCPWVDNCVGHRNYAAFLRFLFFVDVSCSMHLWLISTSLFSSATYYGTEQTTLWLIMLILNYTLCVPVLFVVGCFSFFHFFCLAANTTTIESWEKDKVATMRKRGHVQDVKYPYHLGVLNNVRSVLGANALFWCWPRPVLGDGLSFTTSASVDPIEQYFWPPRPEKLTPDGSAMRRRQHSDAQPIVHGYGQLHPDLRARQGAHDEGMPLAQLNAPRTRRGSEGMEVRSHRWQAEGPHPPVPLYLAQYDDGYGSDDQPRYQLYDPDDNDEQSSVSSLESM